MPVPAVEGVALAGGGCGLAHDALGVGDALLDVLTSEELAAVGDVHDVEQVLLLGVFGPLGEHGHVVLAGHGLLEVDLAQSLLLVGQAVEAGDPVPAGEGVALAGGGCGLAHEALGVGQALLNFLTISKLAAVGDIRDRDLFLLFDFICFVIDIERGDALERRGHVHLDLARCDARDNFRGVIAVECLDAIGNAAVGSDFNISDYVRTVAVTALEEAHNLDLGLCSLVLGPLSEHAAALFNGLGEIDLVGFLLLVGVVRVVSMPIPTGEGVALAGGCRRLRHRAIRSSNANHVLVAVYELAAVSEERDVSLVLILLLVGLVVNIKRSDAFEGGGHIHFDCAGCDARDDRLGGITLDLALNAIRNIAACRNLDNGGLAEAITVAANKVAHNFNALGCVLLPCSKPVASLRGSRLKLETHLLVCRNLAHIRLRVPTREAIASTSGRGEIDPFAFVCLNRGHDLTISELAAISN